MSASNAYSEIGPEVMLRPLATSCAKDYKEHSLAQTSFTEPSNKRIPSSKVHVSRRPKLHWGKTDKISYAPWIWGGGYKWVKIKGQTQMCGYGYWIKWWMCVARLWCERQEQLSQLYERRVMTVSLGSSLASEGFFYLLTCGRRSLVSGTHNETVVSWISLWEMIKVYWLDFSLRFRSRCLLRLCRKFGPKLASHYIPVENEVKFVELSEPFSAN